MSRTIKVYSYHPETLEFLGETIAHESPLEKDVFHIPAFATDKKPLSVKKGKRVVFNTEQSSWVYEDIKEVNNVEDSPAVHPDDILSRDITEKRNGLLSRSDYTQLADFQSSLSKDQKKQWSDYRQALRDLTKQKGFPKEITWPEIPTK